MSDDIEDPIEILVEETDPGIKDVVVETEEDKPTPEIIGPDQGIEALKSKLMAEQVARIEAERRAQAEASRAYAAQNEVQDTQLHMLNGTIGSYTQQANILKSNYAAALENGDYLTAANIQAEMARNAAELLQLEQGRDALKTTPRLRAPEYTPSYAPSDPVEAFASQRTPRSADWIRAHPDFVTDSSKQQRLFAAHNYAVAEGHGVDTDGYFNAVERVLGLDSAQPTRQRASAPPAAPVSRGGGGQGSTKATHVTLSAEERELAANMGLTEKEWAKNKLALIREGRLGN